MKAWPDTTEVSSHSMMVTTPTSDSRERQGGWELSGLCGGGKQGGGGRLWECYQGFLPHEALRVQGPTNCILNDVPNELTIPGSHKWPHSSTVPSSLPWRHLGACHRQVLESNKLVFYEAAVWSWMFLNFLVSQFSHLYKGKKNAHHL